MDHGSSPHRSRVSYGRWVEDVIYAQVFPAVTIGSVCTYSVLCDGVKDDNNSSQSDRPFSSFRLRNEEIQ